MLLWDYLQLFVDTEDRNVDYEQDILVWEKEQGFVSMRRQYEYLRSKFDNLASEAELGKFVSTYADWIIYEDNSYQMKPPLTIALMNILTPDGMIEIADALYKYTPNTIYIVLDKDEIKMEQAIRTGESNEEEGIFVINGWRKSEVELRTCGSSQSRACTAPERNDKRVRGNWEIQMGLIPSRNTNNQVTGWTLSYYWDIRIEGQRRNFLALC